jgi:two-component system phosphate regulon response regulator PhoB
MVERPVLIVEDDPDVSSCLQVLVESSFGIPTVCAADGVGVAALARDLEPRLILLDLALPSVDGIEICRELKSGAATRQLPIVVVSSSPWGIDESRRRATEAGCDVFFHKLYDFHRLVPVLERYLGS